MPRCIGRRGRPLTDDSVSTKGTTGEVGRAAGWCNRGGEEEDWQMSARQLGKTHEKSGLSAGVADRVGWLAQVWTQLPLRRIFLRRPQPQHAGCSRRHTVECSERLHGDTLMFCLLFRFPFHLTWHNDCAFKVQTVSFHLGGVSDGLSALLK